MVTVVDLSTLIFDLGRHMGQEVSIVTALRALRAAEASWPQADAAWLVERAAYLIRRKS